MVQSLFFNNAARLLHTGQHPRLRVVVAVRSLAEIDFLRERVREVFCGEGEDGVRGDAGGRSEDRRSFCHFIYLVVCDYFVD